MASAPAIVLRGIVNRFGPQLVHDGVDLDVRRGEVMGLIGGSGSGKSVLLRSIIGLHRPNAGRIEVLGSDTAGLDGAGREALRERCGVLFQEGALFSSLTVAENIQTPLRERYRLPPHLLDELARLKLSLVGLPPSAGCKFPSELSGGMKKRAGLARAMALDPELLFLDEPTAGLDPIGAAEFDELIRSLQASLGLTVLIVTHDLDSLIRVTDRIAALIDKKAVVGTLAELRRNPHPWLQEYFGGPRSRAAIASAAAASHELAADSGIRGAAGGAGASHELAADSGIRGAAGGAGAGHELAVDSGTPGAAGSAGAGG